MKITLLSSIWWIWVISTFQKYCYLPLCLRYTDIYQHICISLLFPPLHYLYLFPLLFNFYLSFSITAYFSTISAFISILLVVKGMRIIISEKKPVAPTSVHVDGDITSSKIENGNISETERQATDSSGTTSIPYVSTSSTTSFGKEDEEAAVWRVYSIVCSSLSSGSRSSCEWVEDKTRFKDYVTKPKPSGWEKKFH